MDPQAAASALRAVAQALDDLARAVEATPATSAAVAKPGDEGGGHDVATAVTRARVARRLTWVQAARECGVNEKTLRRIASGKRRPTGRTAAAIEAWLAGDNDGGDADQGAAFWSLATRRFNGHATETISSALGIAAPIVAEAQRRRAIPPGVRPEIALDWLRSAS